MEFNGKGFKFTARGIREQRAIQEAVDVLRYGEFNPRAKEVEAEARRKFREQYPVEDEEADAANRGGEPA
jgi:hypothetical protein